MKISKLHLKNFRNHNDFKINFPGDVHIIVGKNGSGKTGVLEAISLLSILRSPRGALTNQMIKHGEELMFIESEIENKNGNKIIRLLFNRNGRKKISINGKELRKATELLGIFKSVFFSLEDIGLVNGGPQNRRKYMDMVLIQSSNEYKYNLQNYIDVLRHRNELIRRVQKGISKEEEMDIWDEKLVAYGIKIVYKRKEFLGKIKWLIKAMYDKLSDGKEELKLRYISTLERNNNASQESNNPTAYDIEYLIKELKKERQKEFKLGMTLLGPHRDDITIIIDGHKINGYGSTGQERSATISFKMAQVEYFYENEGEYPVVLIDDCFVELDDERKHKIWHELDNKTQVILATTKRSEYFGNNKNIHTQELSNITKEQVCFN